MKHLKVLAIGKANQDVFLSGAVFKPVSDHGVMEEQFELGAKLVVDDVAFTTGGNAMNAAITFRRQGLDTAILCMLGTEPSGQAVMKALDDEDIDTRYVVQDERFETSYSTVLLAPNGERTILTHQGGHPHDNGWPFDLKAIDQADWLYISSVGSMELLEKIITKAAEHNVQVAFNPGSRELKEIAKVRSLLEDIAVLIVNRKEMELFVEGRTHEELVQRGLHLVPTVVVSDGPKGVIASDGVKLVKAGMYEDVKVVDRTGAGDAFGSGFVAMHAQGKSLEEAIVFASANSTSVVGQIGATKGILTKHETLHDMPLQVQDI
jgi:sugar/nucleoside kinase (ribokinase family)